MTSADTTSATVTGVCACHSIWTMVGEEVGAIHHPLNPPAIWVGSPSDRPSAVAVQPLFQPSPMMSQQPSGMAQR